MLSSGLYGPHISARPAKRLLPLIENKKMTFSAGSSRASHTCMMRSATLRITEYLPTRMEVRTFFGYSDLMLTARVYQNVSAWYHSCREITYAVWHLIVLGVERREHRESAGVCLLPVCVRVLQPTSQASGEGFFRPDVTLGTGLVRVCHGVVVTEGDRAASNGLLVIRALLLVANL